MLTIATHNLHKGGPETYIAWARMLNAFDPDILLLQESSAPSCYVKALSPEQQEQARFATWAPAAANYWGSGIYLKQGSMDELRLPPELHGWVVGAEVRGLPWYPGMAKALCIFSIHTPSNEPRDYEGDLKAALAAIARLAAGRDVILGGDFNVTISERHAVEEGRNTEGESAIHQTLRDELGLVNCWQSCHPDQPLAQTYRHLFDDEPRSSHLDGLFVPASWQPFLRTCEVHNSPTWRGKGHSDHFPVVATLAP